MSFHVVRHEHPTIFVVNRGASGGEGSQLTAGRSRWIIVRTYPSLPCLLIRGEHPHPDQTPDGVGARWMVGLPAAPLPLQPESKTHDWSLPTDDRAFFVLRPLSPTCGVSYNARACARYGVLADPGSC
jgi:hypothetical protein